MPYHCSVASLTFSTAEVASRVCVHARPSHDQIQLIFITRTTLCSRDDYRMHNTSINFAFEVFRHVFITEDGCIWYQAPFTAILVTDVITKVFKLQVFFRSWFNFCFNSVFWTFRRTPSLSGPSKFASLVGTQVECGRGQVPHPRIQIVTIVHM